MLEVLLSTFRGGGGDADAGVSVVTANTSLFRTGNCLSWAVGGPRLRKHSRPSRYHPSPPFLRRNDMLRQRRTPLLAAKYSVENSVSGAIS